MSLGFFAAAAIYVATGFRASEQVASLAFPLKGGWFIIGQSGDNRLLNYHNPHRGQRCR